MRRIAVLLPIIGVVSCGGGSGTAPPPEIPAAVEADDSATPDALQSAAPADLPPADVFREAPIRIAILLPLSGPAGDVGRAMLNAASLAIFDANDPRLVLLPFDTFGTPDGARRAIDTALDRNIDIVLGPLFGRSIEAIAPTVRAAGLNMIGFSNDRAVAGKGVFLLSFLPSAEVDRVLRYARGRGYETFAALAPETAYGDRVLEQFGATLADTGGRIAAIEMYEQRVEALMQPIQRLADYEARRTAYDREVAFLEDLGGEMAEELLEELKPRETLTPPDFDAVLVAEGDPLIRSLAPLLPFYEVDPQEVKFLGTGLWNDETLLREPPLQGAWFAAPEPGRPAAFLERLNRIFDISAPRLATLAYDAAALVATLAREPVRADRFDRDTLMDPAGFSGLDGAFRFTESGVSERALAILEIDRGGFRIIDPARKNFRLLVGALSGQEIPED